MELINGAGVTETIELTTANTLARAENAFKETRNNIMGTMVASNAVASTAESAWDIIVSTTAGIVAIIINWF